MWHDRAHLFGDVHDAGVEQCQGGLEALGAEAQLQQEGVCGGEVVGGGAAIAAQLQL